MKSKVRVLIVALVGIALLSALLLQPQPALAWGEQGHRMSGRAAGTKLPKPMPDFFRKGAAQFEYLNPEPDRWRSRVLVEMNEAFQYDHFVDLEMVPPAAFTADDRFAYLVALVQGGVNPPEKAGLLQYHILELFQRLRTEFNLWRKTKDSKTRKWIEQRIINDAGILGHYVSDGANPHHTTIHYNGWDKNTPNPNGYTKDNTFHWRFENEYVQSHITLNDLLPKIAPAPRTLTNPRADIMAFLKQGNSLVERLYQLEKQQTFNAQTSAPEHKEFAIERLVAGIEMLRALWWTAWVTSENIS